MPYCVDRHHCEWSWRAFGGNPACVGYRSSRAHDSEQLTSRSRGKACLKEWPLCTLHCRWLGRSPSPVTARLGNHSCRRRRHRVFTSLQRTGREITSLRTLERVPAELPIIYTRGQVYFLHPKMIYFVFLKSYLKKINYIYIKKIKNLKIAIMLKNTNWGCSSIGRAL